jgi:hypothetical protein
LECGEATRVVAVCTSPAAAATVVEAEKARLAALGFEPDDGYFERGQRHLGIYPWG